MNHYYVYCDGILGVKTNIKNFQWAYGSVAPERESNEYERCAVRFEIYAKSEDELKSNGWTEQFQAYSWDESKHKLSYRRTMLGTIRLGYDITFENNRIIADIGKNYYRLVQKRLMHMHGIYYLLADLANMILLKNGFITVYASVVHDPVTGKGIAFFAPPNTGKTVTATELCLKNGYRLVGEDLIIANGLKMYACPWTASFRKKKTAFDGAGAFGRTMAIPEINRCDSCELTDMIVLSMGDNRVLGDKSETLRRISILNGYLFENYASPIIKILGYFDTSYHRDWNQYAVQYLSRLAENSNCSLVYANSPVEFGAIVHELTGEKT